MGVAAAQTVPCVNKVRIGTYDPRAIAVAYAHSPLHQKLLASKMKEMKDAKAAGDQKKVAELEKWGESQQRLLHMQGFAGAPVNEILAEVKSQIADVAQKAHVDLIARQADWTSAGVEVFDVTDELVKLFNPNEKVWKTVRALRTQPMAKLEDIAVMKD